MKILFVTPRYHTNLTGWIKVLYEEGHNISMCVLNKSNIENYSIVKPKLLKLSYVSILIMKIIGTGTNYSRGFPNILNYFKYLKNISPDLIIIRDPNRFFSIITLILTSLLAKKKIIYSQTPLFKKYSYRRKIIIFLLLKIFKAKWITPIYGENKFVYHPKEMYFLPFISNFYIDYNKMKSNKNIIKLLCVAKFGYTRKNIILLLKSFKILSKDFNIYLTIIGEYPNKNIGDSQNNIDINYIERIKNYIDHENLKKYVNLVFDVPHSKIENFYKNNDLFVLPSTNEPASISVVEAISMGLPVICSDKCGTKYYIENDYNGFIFKDNSLYSLTKVLRKSLQIKKLEQLKKNSFSYYNEHLTHKNFIEKFNTLIQ